MKKQTVREFAEENGISEQAVKDRIKRGTLIASKVKGKWEIHIQSQVPQVDKQGQSQVPQVDKQGQSQVPQVDKQGQSQVPQVGKQGQSQVPQVDKQVITKEDIENQSAQTRTLVNAHDNRWQHEIQKIHEDHSKEIRELRDEYKDEAKRKMMPFYVVCVIGLISLGGLLWYFNEQIKAEKLEKKAVIEMGLNKESELKKEHSEEVSLIQKEARSIQSEIQLRLEASRLKSEASKTALQSKIDQLNEGRVIEAKTQAELSAKLQVLQGKFEREMEKHKSDLELLKQQKEPYRKEENLDFDKAENK